MSVFGRLGYTPYSGSSVSNLSDAVKKQMDSMPDMLQPWQKEDMANNNVSDYFKNPLQTSIQNVWNSANNIIAVPNLASTNVSSILTAAQSLYASANNFYNHTNRLSGLSEPPESDPTLPTYKTASSVGKMVMYIVYQTDGVQNNSPMVACFSSLYTKSDLDAYSNIIQGYATTIQNSITTISIEEPPSTSYTSNLTQQQANNMIANLSSITSFMNDRRTADVNFYYNSRTIVEEYNTLKTFSNMGQTQTDMVTNLIGSDKLLQRLNS